MAAMKRSLVLLLVALLVFMSQSSSRSVVAAVREDVALTVANKLALPLTLLHVPGCCTPCGWIDPPPGVQCDVQGCVQCPNLVLDPGTSITLNKKVGPYPLPSLQVQVQDAVVYCVAAHDLKLITASVLLTVGPGQCTGNHGTLQALVSKLVTSAGHGEKAWIPVATLCLPVCSA